MSDSLRALVAQSNEITSAIVAGNGVLSPEMEAAMTVVDQKLPAKIDGYAIIMERLEHEEIYWKGKAEFYAATAKTLDNKRKAMKENLKFAMNELGVDELKGVDVRFKLSNSKPQLVIKEEYLDAKYLKSETVTKPDRAAIEADLKAGIEVEGAMLLETKAIRHYANTKAGDK